MTKASPSVALLCTGLFLISTSISAQEYILNGNLNGQTIETCGGTLYDSGGPNGTYDSGEDYTVTFCTADEEECLKVNLSSFNTESGWDFLNIFDGPDENSTLIGSFSGQNAPDVLYGSGACMTFNITSDGSVTITTPGVYYSTNGIDLSNVDRGQAALLPEDSDRSARRIRDGLRARAGVEVGRSRLLLIGATT